MVMDGGWGWAVVAGGALYNLLSMGLYRSGGIIFVASLRTFHTSRSVASWIPMVTLMVVFLTAPVGTALCKKYSYHSVTFCGGVLASLGMFLCYLATRIEFLFIGWGVTFGLGSSLAFFPSIALVGSYFKEKRPLANGIVLTGGALGAFCLPPLLELLVENYGLNGAALIMGGVTLHYVVTSYLLLIVTRVTIPKSRNRIRNDKEKELSPDECGSVIEVHENVADQEEGDYYRRTKRRSLTRSFKELVEALDLKVICNHTFLINCSSNAIQTSLFLGMVILLPDFGQDEVGVSRIEAAYFVSASAISDLSTRFLSGWLLTHVKCKRSLMYLVVLLLNSITFIIISLTRSYAVVMAAAILAGTCFASGMILYFEILASCQTADKYPMAFGLSEMMKAPLLLCTASSVGSLKDATGSYTTTLLIFVGSAIFASSLWILEFLLLRKDSRLREIPPS